jgi:hypothetical protein
MDLPTTTVLAHSGNNPSNLKVDTKSLVWRSTNATQGSIILDFGTTKTVGGVILAFTNLTSSATIRLVGYNAPNTPSITSNLLTTGVTAAFNTGHLSCSPWNNLNLPNWGTNPTTSSNYSYGGGTYGRVWLNTTQAAQPIRYLGIEVINTGSTAAYIEASRIIVGDYWSPKYNVGYGISAGIKDLSEHLRTESGDLITRRGPRIRTLNFNLEWLASIDRKEMTKILLGNGLPKPLFVSLFPDSTGTDEDFQREGIHQVYGKMMTVPGVSYTHYEIYSTTMELEEV